MIETGIETTPGGLNRRLALQRVALGAAGVAATAAFGMGGLVAASKPAHAASALTDVQILNFALNLEYLEAEFYLRAIGQPGLTAGVTTGVGTKGTVTGGQRVPFKTAAIAQTAIRLALDEQAHVLTLRGALGSAAVAEPSIDLETSFTTLAVAAGLVPSGGKFNPFDNEVDFLLGAYIFEDVGVSAYAGAANLISNPAYLAAAASILAIEGYHAGAIRSQLGQIGGAPANYTVAISALRAKLSGVADIGVVAPSGPPGYGLSDNFSNDDADGLAYRRTPTEVLAIVYGGGTSSGLFFPAGINAGIASA